MGWSSQKGCEMWCLFLGNQNGKNELHNCFSYHSLCCGHKVVTQHVDCGVLTADLYRAINSICCTSLFVSRLWAVTGSVLILFVPVRMWSLSVRRRAELLLCLLVGIHASGISIPLSPLMFLGWNEVCIASLTLRECRYESLNSSIKQLTWRSKAGGGRCPSRFGPPPPPPNLDPLCSCKNPRCYSHVKYRNNFTFQSWRRNVSFGFQNTANLFINRGRVRLDQVTWQFVLGTQPDL